MSFWDVALLSYRASIPTTFLKHCSRGESLATATCLGAVVGGKQGHAPCKVFSLQQTLFLCQSYFIEITRLWQR